MYLIRPELINERNWVVVCGDTITHYETFKEALNDKGGNLMTLAYYEYHYKFIN
jgi:hypothetical protein